MDAFPTFEVVGVIICIIMSAYFSGTETALTALSEVKSEIMRDKYPLIAPVLKKWKENPSLILSSLLVGNNIVNIFGALLAGKVASFALESHGQAVADAAAVAGMTLFVLIFGEVTPKTFAKLMPERWLFPTLLLYRIFSWILLPFAVVLSKFAGWVVKFMGGENENSEMTQNEIEYMIQKGSDEGVFEQEEQGELLTSVIEFKDTLVKEIMTPRTDSNFLEVDTTIAEAMEKIEEWGHSRIPVYEDSVDNIKGILYVKDLAMLITKDKSVLNDNILSVARKGVFYVPETQKINETLKKMRAEGNHLGIVVDEFGGTSGIITLEDVLEELVGEIWDEDDVVEEPIRKLEEHSCVCDDDVHVGDIFDFLEYEDPEENEELDTKIVAEWAYENFGNIPKVGDSFRYHELEVKVFEMDHNRITALTVTVLPSEEEKGGEE